MMNIWPAGRVAVDGPGGREDNMDCSTSGRGALEVIHGDDPASDFGERFRNPPPQAPAPAKATCPEPCSDDQLGGFLADGSGS